MQSKTADFKKNNSAYFRAVISQHPLFSAWPSDVLVRFAKLWTVETFEPGKKIVREGTEVDSIYFIIEGNCEVIAHDKADPTRIHTLAVLYPGEAVGLSATGLFSQTSERTATVIALSKVVTITIKLKTLRGFLSQNPSLNMKFQDSITRTLKLHLAKECTPFAKLSLTKLNDIADKIEEIEVPENTTLFKEGEAADYEYLIAEGEVEITRSDENHHSYLISDLTPVSIFGEVNTIFNAPRSVTAKTVRKCKLYRLHRKELIKAFASEKVFNEEHMKKIIKQSRPEQIANVVERHESYSDQTERIILKNIKNKELYRLNERSFYAWQLMDGKNTIENIDLTIKQRYADNSIEELLTLINDLRVNGFIQILGYKFKNKQKAKSFWQKLLSMFK